MQQPVWPSVEEQLAQANVVPGSTLAQLVRNNQDFHLLRPEEVNDTIGLPLWLRIYWRKQHPERIYAANDSTVGYPRVLKNVYAWMLTHQDLRPSPPPAPAEPTDGVAPSVPSAIASRVAIGSNRRISGVQTTPRYESDIRVNYQNSDKIIAASNDIGGWQKQFYSRDGGTTWGQTSLIPVFKDTQQTDPTVDWTSDGMAWAITIGIELHPEDGGKGGPKKLLFSLRAYRSSDGGATWAFDATISGSQTTPDKEMMWVDHSPTSPFKDNIYVIWHYVLGLNSLAFVARRTEGAWQAPVQVSGPETTREALGGDIKTNSAGDVFAFWPDTGSRKLWVAKSINGGAIFSSPIPITTTFASNAIGVPSFRGAMIYLSGGAYRTATKDLVYATWVDLTGTPGCTSSANGPGPNASSTCKTRIWFSRSTHGGTMWESARMINNQASLNDQFHPRLAVDEFNGRLVVVYYDTVSDPGRKKTDIWFQSSDDDGVTWSIPIKVTTAQTDETTGVGADYFEVIQAHKNVLALPNKAALTALERLTHTTKKNPTPAMPLEEIGEHIPAMFRRAAIRAALGSARSFSSHLSRWKKRKEKAQARGKQFTERPPVPPRTWNKSALLYAGQWKERTCSSIVLKVWTGSCWSWIKVRITGRELPADVELGSPSLIRRGNQWWLHTPIEKLFSSPPNIEKQVTANAETKICAVDLNMNEHVAVCTIQTVEGTILATRFIGGGREISGFRKQLLGRIARNRRQTGIIGEGEQDNADLWRKINNVDDAMAHLVSARIVQFAKQHEATIVVFEHLLNLKPHKGTYSHRGNRKRAYWMKGRIFTYAKYKSYHEGILTSRVNPRNTSHECARCHGLVARYASRHPADGYTSGAPLVLCQACGMRGNADRNASLVIGSRLITRYHKSSQEKPPPPLAIERGEKSPGVAVCQDAKSEEEPSILQARHAESNEHGTAQDGSLGMAERLSDIPHPLRLPLE